LDAQAVPEGKVQIFAGLGNPGGQYARNRHNIGFMALDRIAGENGFGPWKAKFQGEVSEGRLGGDKVILLKPMTYMNRSGQSVGEAMRFYKLEPEDVTVFHDELDLAPGKCKVKQGGGHAGHNGLRSIHGHIGDAYARVRLGIGHPGRKELVAGYVLHDFAKGDEGWLDDLLRGVADGADDLAAGDSGRFLNAVALRVAPPRSGTGAKGAETAKNDAKSPGPTSAPKTNASPGNAPEPPAEPDTRSALQKLADRFR
jgi:PTH1 family peptidyl-tRNA hydrolase